MLDTNIISHLIRSKRPPDPGVVDFLDAVDEHRLYLSVLTIGEIQKGIDRIPWPAAQSHADVFPRKRLQSTLEQRLEALCDRFAGRILAVDGKVARQWGRFHAEQERLGRPTPVVDTMIAAIAHSHGLILATADADFVAFEWILRVYNPISGHLLGPTSLFAESD